MPTIPSPVDATPLAYDVTAGGDGVPVLLLHGSVLTRAIWRGLGYLGPLSQGRPVIRMDLRGHGRSGHPHDPAAYTQETLAADALAVLDAAGTPQVDLVGYSLGARTALTVALTHPQRVRRLVSLGGSASDQRGALDSVFYPGVIDSLRASGMEAFCAAQGLDAPSVEAAGSRFQTATRQAFLAADPQAMAALFTATDATGPIPEDSLAACGIPTLWMAGSEDHPRWEDSRRAAEIMPSARFVSLPARTHGSTLAPAGPVLEEILAHLDA